MADRRVVDGFLDGLANWTYTVGVLLRSLQTGRLRQYVMFIVVGAIALFLVINFLWSPGLAN